MDSMRDLGRRLTGTTPKIAEVSPALDTHRKDEVQKPLETEVKERNWPTEKIDRPKPTDIKGLIVGYEKNLPVLTINDYARLSDNAVNSDDYHKPSFSPDQRYQPGTTWDFNGYFQGNNHTEQFPQRYIIDEMRYKGALTNGKNVEINIQGACQSDDGRLYVGDHTTKPTAGYVISFTHDGDRKLTQVPINLDVQTDPLAREKARVIHDQVIAALNDGMPPKDIEGFVTQMAKTLSEANENKFKSLFKPELPAPAPQLAETVNIDELIIDQKNGLPVILSKTNNELDFTDMRAFGEQAVASFDFIGYVRTNDDIDFYIDTMVTRGLLADNAHPGISVATDGVRSWHRTRLDPNLDRNVEEYKMEIRVPVALQRKFGIYIDDSNECRKAASGDRESQRSEFFDVDTGLNVPNDPKAREKARVMHDRVVDMVASGISPLAISETVKATKQIEGEQTDSPKQLA
ncbi:MAG: hypothetical protein WCV88_03915 [Patescibacteria group bacterium]